MELRRFLFDHRVKQQEIVAMARSLGLTIYGPDVSNVNRGKGHPGHKRVIAAALIALGYKAAMVERINELK